MVGGVRGLDFFGRCGRGGGSGRVEAGKERAEGVAVRDRGGRSLVEQLAVAFRLGFEPELGGMVDTGERAFLLEGEADRVHGAPFDVCLDNEDGVGEAALYSVAVGESLSNWSGSDRVFAGEAPAGVEQAFGEFPVRGGVHPVEAVGEHGDAGAVGLQTADMGMCVASEREAADDDAPVFGGRVAGTVGDFLSE